MNNKISSTKLSQTQIISSSSLSSPSPSSLPLPLKQLEFTLSNKSSFMVKHSRSKVLSSKLPIQFGQYLQINKNQYRINMKSNNLCSIKNMERKNVEEQKAEEQRHKTKVMRNKNSNREQQQEIQQEIIMKIQSLTNPQIVNISPFKSYILSKQKLKKSIPPLAVEHSKLFINPTRIRLQESSQKFKNKQMVTISESDPIQNDNKLFISNKLKYYQQRFYHQEDHNEIQLLERMMENHFEALGQNNQAAQELQEKYNPSQKRQKNRHHSNNIKTKDKFKLPEVHPTKEIQNNLKTTQKQYPLLHKQPHELTNIKAQSYIVLQYPSQRIVISHRPNTSLEIASLTKIMTFYTVVEIVKRFRVDLQREVVRISKKVEDIGGTSAELIQDEDYTIQQLLYGLMLPSGNDAANELSFWGGNLLLQKTHTKDPAQLSSPEDKSKAFVLQMNRLSKNLGLKSTKFGNPHGLPHQDGRSTAIDVAKLCCICMKIQLFRKIVSTKKYQCCVDTNNGKLVNSPKGDKQIMIDDKRQISWENTNKLLRRQGFIGIKTGITVTAGPCLASAYQFKGKTYISVILRAPKVSSRFRQTRQLIHWCLTKLYPVQSGCLSQSQKLTLKRLKKSNPVQDSDYSEDQHEFKYDVAAGSTEYNRRVKILKYQL